MLSNLVKNRMLDVDGGANGGSNPNPNDGKDNGNIPGIGDTGGIDLGSPYKGNYGYSPEWTDYSKEC